MLKQILLLSIIFTLSAFTAIAEDKGAVEVNLEDNKILNDVAATGSSGYIKSNVQKLNEETPTVNADANRNYDFALWAPTIFKPRIPRDEQITNRDRLLKLANAKATIYTRSDVRGQEGGLEMQQYEVTANVPLFIKDGELLIFDVNYQATNFDTNIRLNNTDTNSYGHALLGVDLPNTLHSLDFGVHYRKPISSEMFCGFFKGWTVGADGYIGSSSDKLFNSIEEIDFATLANVRIPIFERQAITVMAGYLSQFKLPVAGVAYQLNFGDTSFISAGFPMAKAHINSADVFCIETDRANFDFNWTFRGNTDARLSWDFIRGKFQAFTKYEYRVNRWLRANRSDTKSRIFYTDMHWGGGLRLDFAKHFYIEGEAGWAFSRNIFEARNLGGSDAGFDINDSLYGTIQGGIVF